MAAVRTRHMMTTVVKRTVFPTLIIDFGPTFLSKFQAFYYSISDLFRISTFKLYFCRCKGFFWTLENIQFFLSLFLFYLSQKVPLFGLGGAQNALLARFAFLMADGMEEEKSLFSVFPERNTKVDHCTWKAKHMIILYHDVFFSHVKPCITRWALPLQLPPFQIRKRVEKFDNVFAVQK